MLLALALLIYASKVVCPSFFAPDSKGDESHSMRAIIDCASYVGDESQSMMAIRACESYVGD